MKIAWDVDGVFTDLNEYLIKYGTKFFKRSPINHDCDNICDMFNCSKQQEYLFWRRHAVHYSLNVKFRCGAAKIFNRLVADGHDVHIATARIKCYENSLSGKIMRKLFFRSLAKNKINISADKVHFFSTTNTDVLKANFLTKNSFDYIIEDSPKNLLAVAEHSSCKAIAFVTSYNYNLTLNALKFNSFYQIYNFISKQDGTTLFYYKGRKTLNLMQNEDITNFYVMLRSFYRFKYISNLNLRKNLGFQKLAYYIITPFLNVIYNLEINNQHLLLNKNDNIGTIFVVNHKSLQDTIVFYKVIGKTIFYPLFKEELRKSFLGWFYHLWGCVYIKRKNKDSEIMAIEELTSLVLKGKNILIFPEGTRNKDNTTNTLLPFQKGAATIAQNTGAKIIPLCINYNTGGIKGNISVTVCEPVCVGIDEVPQNKIDCIRENMQNILNEL